jgi:hypothetical protein
LDFGAILSHDALYACIAQDNFEIFQSLVSNFSFGTCKNWDFLERFKSSEAQWLQMILDQVENSSLGLEILQHAIQECDFMVWEKFVKSSERAMDLICQYPEVDGIILALSTFTPNVLRGIFGSYVKGLINDRQRSEELLHLSIMHDNAQLKRFLVDTGLPLDVVIRNKGHQDTAHSAAIRHCNTDLFELIVNVGASMVVPTGSWCTYGHPTYINALVTAVECEEVVFARRLLENGAEINSYGISSFFDAEFWQTIHFDHSLSTCTCRCCCATPLTAYLLGGSSLTLLLMLLDSIPNLGHLSSLYETNANHLRPLASILLSPIHHYHNSEYMLLAT